MQTTLRDLFATKARNCDNPLGPAPITNTFLVSITNLWSKGMVPNWIIDIYLRLQVTFRRNNAVDEIDRWSDEEDGVDHVEY